MSEQPCRHCQTEIPPKSKKCPHCDTPYPLDRFIGRTIRGDVEIRGRIGEGGMGVVYKGVKIALDREVAVKILHSGEHMTEQAVAYFMREARLLSKLRHPNLVSVLDFGREEDGTLLMVMEYLPGKPLDDIINNQAPLAVDRSLRIMLQVLGALEAVHRENIIHRDLKPDNIIVESIVGQGDFAKVLDFGIAKISEENKDTFSKTLTTAGAMVGTPYYMSPEQAQSLPLDPRSDLYAAGVVLFEMLTNHLPFTGDNIVAILARRITEDAPLASSFRPELPEIIDQICAKAMARKPDDRYASAQAFRADLEFALVQHNPAASSGMYAFSGAAHSVGLRIPSSEHSAIPSLQTPGLSHSSPEAAVLAMEVWKRSPDGLSTSPSESEIHDLYTFIEQFVLNSGGMTTGREEQTFFALFELRVGEDNAQNLVRVIDTILQMRGAAWHRFPHLRIQMGFDSGRIFAHSGGNPFSQGEIPIGNPVRRALKQAGRAHKRRLLISADLAEVLEDYALLEARGREYEVLALAGQLPDAWLENSQIPLSTLDQPAVESLPTVGMESVRDSLESVLVDLSQHGKSSAMALVGPAGCGKTHLLTTTALQAKARGIQTVTVSCAEERNIRPFHVFFDFIRKALYTLTRAQAEALGGDSKPPETPAELRHGLETIGLDEDHAIVLVEQFVSGTLDDPSMIFAGQTSSFLSHAHLRQSLQSVPPLEHQRTLLFAVRKFLEILCARGGFLLLVDDVDRSDSASLSALSSLVRFNAPEGMAVLITYTADRAHNDAAVQGFQVQNIPALSNAECDELWQLHQHDIFSPDLGLERRVKAAAQGNPMFIVRWSHDPLEGDPPHDPLTLVSAQLPRMSGRIQRILLIASVLGQSFRLRWLKTLFPQSDTLLSVLQETLELGLLEPHSEDDEWWRFRNAAVYQAAYRSMNRETRVRYHVNIYQKIAQPNPHEDLLLLEAFQSCKGNLSTEGSERAERIADCFAVSGDLSGAYSWYIIASREARSVFEQNSDEAQSAGYYQRCVELSLKTAEIALRIGLPQDAYESLRVFKPRSRLQILRSVILRARISLHAQNAQETERLLDPIFKDPRLRHPLLYSAAILRAQVALQSKQRKKALAIFEDVLQKLSHFKGELPGDLEYLGWWVPMRCADLHHQARNHPRAKDLVLFALQRAVILSDVSGAIHSLKILRRICTQTHEEGLFLEETKKLLKNKLIRFRSTHYALLYQLLGTGFQAIQEYESAQNAYQCSLDVAMNLSWDALVRQNQTSIKRLAVLSQKTPSLAVAPTLQLASVPDAHQRD